VANSAPAVNHLLFADDSLLFVKASVEGAGEVDEVLDIYCQASGQRVNLDKSSVFFSKGCPMGIRTAMKERLKVQNESLSEKYLGMPSDVGRSVRGAFKYLSDRVWKRVQGWLEILLSAAGKEILIKSVAQAIPTFSMSCFKLPRGLCQHINGLLRNFWWGCRNGKRKTCWVSWEEMCTPKYAGGLGFRDIELFNLSLLARQAWRILQSPDTLSAKILKARYYPDCDFLDALEGSHPSQIWRSIIEGREVMKQGLIRRIGTGEKTNAWNDNWIPRDTMMRPITCLKRDPPTLVAELMDSIAACWNVQKLQEFFLPMDVEAILSIPVSTSRMEDFWAWKHERTGIFSVRSAYRMLVNVRSRREAWLDGRATTSDHAAEEKQWSSLWKIQAPSKIKVFLWRLAKQSIPTGDVRHRRNMAPDSSCTLCGEVDSWRHSLIECRMSRCIWALAPEAITEHMEGTVEPEAKQWLFSMIDSLNHPDLTRCFVTLWAVWYARRKAIHEEIYQSPLSTHAFVESMMRDLEVASSCTKKANPQASRTVPTESWIPPPQGMVKINVDAAVRKTEKVGAVAAICRSANGDFLGASVVVVEGINDPAILEAMACREALALALDLDLTHVRVASDCAEVINSLEGNYMGSFSSVISEIKSRSLHFNAISFVHEGRSSNMEAHGLARATVNHDVGRHIWLAQAPDFFCIPMNIIVE
jgi:ribonuclease HI